MESIIYIELISITVSYIYINDKFLHYFYTKFRLPGFDYTFQEVFWTRFGHILENVCLRVFLYMW